MEEKKKAKQISLNADNAKKDGRLSYEELNNTCMQLYQQNQNMLRQLRQLDMSNMFKRLDYLFMVLKYESVIKDAEFINNCVEEIKEAITVPKEEPASSQEKEG